MPSVGYWNKRRELEDNPEFQAMIKKRYIEERDAILDAIIEEHAATLDDLNKPVFARHVREWAAGWDIPPHLARERAWVRTDPTYQMRELLTNIDKYKKLLDAEIERQDSHSTPNGANAVVQYHRIWMEAQGKLVDLEDKTELEQDRFLNVGEWKALKKQWYSKLKREYKGKGPIYLGLCERLASLNAALTRLEEEGKVDTAVYQTLSVQALDIAAQIQKHTESMKMEVSETHVQEIGERFLRLIEPLLFNQPALMDRICEVIEGNSDNLIEGNVLQLPERASA
jgi:hypothetical protein